MEFKDYYKILGIDRKADQKAVTKAFRRLAREFHPDVNKGKGAEDRFKEVNEAYQVLGDPAKRGQYDQVYEAYKNGGVPLQDLFGRGRRGGGAWSSGPGGFTVVGDPEELEEILGRGGFSDFFQQLFGGGFDRTQGESPRARLETTAEITLEEAYRGTRRRVSLPSGKTVDVEIPPGVRSGQTLRLPRAADGQDIYLTVQLTPHRLFERSDGDLTIEVPITMSEAALGAQVEVPTLDRNVTVTVPPGTQTGRRLRLKGLGMPRAASGDSHGDLYVRVKVVTPTDLSKHERELFEALQKARKESPRQGIKR